MSTKWIVRIFGVLLFVGSAIAGFGQTVHQLWNLLMPGRQRSGAPCPPVFSLRPQNALVSARLATVPPLFR